MYLKPAAVQSKKMERVKLRIRLRRKAVATVEFAVLAPILFTMMFGIFEMGRAFIVKKTLTSAVRQGCRTGILPLKDTAAVQTDVKAVLDASNIDSTKATITVLLNGVATDVKNAKPGDQISVQVSIPFSAVAWVTPLLMQNRNVTSESLIMVRQA